MRSFDDWTAGARAVPIEREIERRGIELRGHIEQCGPCPRCGGDDRFSINRKKQVWNCRGCGIGGDVIKLVQHLDGVDFKTACMTLVGEPPPKANGWDCTSEPKKLLAAEFRYENEGGAVLFVVERLEYQNADGSFVVTERGKRKKTFRQKRPDPDRPGRWLSNVDGVPPIPYRLAELIEAIAVDCAVLIVEGEAKVDLLRSWNIPATCCAGGAKKWRAAHAAFLRGANVVILPDNDDAGQAHMNTVAASLQGLAASIRVLELPGLSPKGDIVDWAASGGTAEQLHSLVDSAPEWIPDATTKAAQATLRPGLDAGEKRPHDHLTDRTESPSTRLAEDNVRSDGGSRSRSQADILIEIAQNAELFHTSGGSGFADLSINDHRETWPIRAKNFRRWLARGFFEMTGGAPNSEALQSALNIIEAKAHFDSPERLVHARVGGLGGRLYIDLADESWRALEIDTTGWRVIERPPVHFRRAAGMQALPMPVSGGSVGMLRSFLNVRTDSDFALVVAWVLASLRDRGPYPIMVLSGEQGSAKSTFSAILRALLDPNTAPLRALPREDRDLFIAANNGHVLCFDNVSGLPAWLSDTLCRLATGGGFAVRQLYSDQDEVLFDATKPVILNGIEDIVTRPDLADRAVFLTLEAIPEKKRKSEQELWAEFESKRPLIIGALLDAVSHGLRQLPNVHLDRLPRMADFAHWATACESAIWQAGTFSAAYGGNRDEAVDGVIDADPVAAAVRLLMGEMKERSGRTKRTETASALLAALEEVAGERVAKSKTWPDNPRALSNRLRRAATFLRKLGIEVSFHREGKARTRIITLSATEEEGIFASASGPFRLRIALWRVRAEHREPAFVCHAHLLTGGLDRRSGLIRHRRCVLRCRGTGTAGVLYGALLGRSTKSATRPRLISERVISASGARSLLFGPALGHRRRRCIPLALKRLQRAGRINAWRSPDELDHLLKLGSAERGHNLVDSCAHGAARQPR